MEIKMSTLNKIFIPTHFQHITAFLTMACPLDCSYCSNKLKGIPKNRKNINGDQWIEIFNRLETNLSIILFGGEPLAHPDFYKIINGVNPNVKFEMLSTFPYDIKKFIKNVSPDRFTQDLPYPSIRIAYHPESMDLDEIIFKTQQLKHSGFSVVLTFVNHPSITSKTLEYKNKIDRAGIKCAVRPFFGKDNDGIHGNLKYKDCIEMEKTKNVQCKPLGIYIDTTGDGYGCRAKTLIQKTEDKIGNFLDPTFVALEEKYYFCNMFGQCHFSDITYRGDRYQKWGFCCVDIKGSHVEILPTPVQSDWID